MMLANDYPSDLDVMGQTITFDENTVFTSHVKGVQSINDITESSALEVSGYTTGTGSFYATNIVVNKSVTSDQDILRVRGIIDSLSFSCFRIGQIDVCFDKETSFININNNLVLPGMAVVMAGVFADDDISSSVRVFNAASIEALNPDVGAGDHVEVVGVIRTKDASKQTFSINDMIVQITAVTATKNDKLSDFNNGMSVEVKGVVDQNGILVADNINISRT